MRLAEQTLSMRLTLDTPDGAVAAASANRLAEFGLHVDHVSSRALLLSGSKAMFERVFSAPISVEGGQSRFKVAPNFAILPSDGSYRAYFPSQPTYFGEGDGAKGGGSSGS